VGVEGSWNEDAYTSLNEPPPFDEPALGIIGMWRLGGGANPHFALALAGLMERVDQPLLAWTCYARAAELAERFWPDPAIQAGLLEHCHYRQLNLAARIGRPMESLRADFVARLAGGKARMQAYEEEEARRIAGGSFKESLPFDMEQATRANGERSHAFQDSINVPLEELSPLAPARLVSLLPHGILGAGVFVFLASLVREWRPVRKPARA
jgi:hypothetical protein